MSHRPVRRSSGQDLSPLLRICHAVYRLLRVLTLRNSRNLQVNKNRDTLISAADSTKKISNTKQGFVSLQICSDEGGALCEGYNLPSKKLQVYSYYCNKSCFSSLTCTVWTCGDWMTEGWAAWITPCTWTV